MTTVFTKRAFAASVLALLLCGAGCPNLAELFLKNAPGSEETEKGRPLGLPDLNVAPNRTEFWNTVAPGMEREVITIPTDDPKAPINVTIFKLDPDDYKGRVLSDLGNPKSVLEWASTIPRGEDGRLVDMLVVNASYFNPDFTPSGFLAVDGQPIGKTIYDLDKSGLVTLQPHFNVIDTNITPMTPDAAATPHAVQSFPFLISGGQPAIQKDSGQKSRRTFIGNDKQGNIYVGLVTDSVVSLYHLMNIIQEHGRVKWENVINLDGGPSTGYVANWDNATHAFDSFSKVPNVVAFVRVPKEAAR